VLQNYDDAYVTEAQHVSDSGGVESRAMQNYDDAYVTEAQHVSDSGGVDSAVMERAVMMAYDMMKKKKLELNETVGDTHAAEQQYAMMVQATQDLVTQYKEDPSTFKITHARNLNGYEVAVELLESVIADASQQMVDVEDSQKLVITQFYDLLDQALKRPLVEENFVLEEQKEDEMKSQTQPTVVSMVRSNEKSWGVA